MLVRDVHSGRGVQTKAPGWLESLRFHKLPLRIDGYAEIHARSPVEGEAKAMVAAVANLLTGPPVEVSPRSNSDYNEHVRAFTEYLRGRGRVVNFKELKALMRELDDTPPPREEE